MEVHKTQFVQMIHQNRGIINSLCQLYYRRVEDREDARQDIILQLWRSYPSFRQESAVSTWVYRVALNTLLAKIRKEKRCLPSESLESTDEANWMAIPQADDDLQLLHQIIQSLRPQDKAVVILYLEGYKNREIAEMLAMSPTNVSTKLNRIKTTLKKQYINLSYESR